VCKTISQPNNKPINSAFRNHISNSTELKGFQISKSLQNNRSVSTQLTAAQSFICVLTVVREAKNSVAFYGNQMFIPVITTACHCSIHWIVAGKVHISLEQSHSELISHKCHNLAGSYCLLRREGCG
jgi:hypothetical protein